MRGKKKYRGVVIGCGNIGALFEQEPKRPKPATHAGAFSTNPRTELIALVDTDSRTLAAAGKLFPSARRYGSVQDALDSEHPDIVAIATPPTTHAALIELCAKSGVRTIICEKPLADTSAEAQKIADVVKTYDLRLVLNYQRRFFTLLANVRQEIQAGKLGTLQQVTCYYSNGVYTNGGHSIDTALFLLDEPVRSAIGIEQSLNHTHPVGDTNIDGILQTPGGVPIVLQSFDQQAYGMHELRIYGTQGAIVIRDYGYEVLHLSTRASLFKGLRKLVWPTAVKRREESMVAGALNEAVRVRDTGHAPLSGVENGIETLRVLDALKKSARLSGTLISL